MDYKSFVEATRRTSEDEERKRKERLQRLQASRKDAQRRQENERPVTDRIGEVLSGVANFGKEMLADPIAESIDIAGKGIGRAVDDFTGTTAARTAEYEKSQDEWQRMLTTQLEKSKDPSISQEERDKARESASSISRNMDQEYKSFQAETGQAIEETDPMKNVGALGTLASTVTPAKIGTLGARLGSKGLAATSKLGKAGEAVVSDVIIGGAAGASEQLRREGGNASAEDLAGAAGTGALFGGALSAGGQLLNKGVRQEAGALTRRGVAAVDDARASYNALPQAVREGGYVQVPGAADDIAETVAPKQTPDTIDPAVAPTTTPGEVNPVTGLRDNTLPEDQGIVTKSREQIMKDNKVQRSFSERVNESLFDANAPLRAYAKAYKEKTGEVLDAADDPAALAQLRNGMDEAGAARLQTLVDDMEFIRSNKLTDAWKEYGIANQVVNDRADIYSPTIVAAEAKKLEDLQARLKPEEFQQVQAAVQKTIDFQDQQLVRLRDNGFVSQEAYDAIKEVNPNYFTRFNFAEYIDDNQRLFASTNSKNVGKNIVQAVQGKGEDAKYIIEDPAEAITRSALKTENIIQNNKVFSAIGRLSEDLPEMAIKLRDADNVQARMSLSIENNELRPVRNKLERIIKSGSRDLRRLESQINKLEKQGMNLSLKKGGERMAPGDFTVAGLGGDVPTSQAGQVVKTANDDATDLIQQLESSVRRNPDSPRSTGLKQDVIAEQAGTLAETNPSMLGPSDTKAFLYNLIENGSRRDIDKLKQMVGRRDQKLNALLDDIGFTKSEYDEVATKIRDNISEGKAHADLDVPEGYEAVTGWRDGIQERIAVPSYIAQAYKGKNDAQVGAMERIMMAASKPFKAAATIFSPAFLVKNSIRDTGTHWLTSQNISKAERLAIAPYAKRWAQGFIDSLTNSEFSQKVASEGGGAAGVFSNVGDTQKIVRDLTKKVAGQEVKTADGMFREALRMTGKYTGVTPAFNAYAGTMQRMGRALEYAPRLAEARAAIEKGASDPAAALAARNALGDLQNGGTISRLLNNYTPFFNSILQGNKRIVDAARENPQNAMVMAAAGIALPAATGYLWNRTMYPDVLNQIPEWERESNFVIILGDEQDKEGNYTQVIKIPKNDAAKVFGNNLEVALDKMAGEDSQTFAELFLKTIGYAQPFQVEKDGELSLDAMVGSAPGVSNPLVRTPVELASNHSFFTGRDIVPEYLQGLDSKDQVTDKTAPIDALAAQVGISPQQSAVVRQGVSAGLLNGKNPVDQVKNVGVGSSGTRGQNEFYKIRDDVSNLKKKASLAINKSIEEGDYESAQAIAQEYNALRVQKFAPWVETYSDSATDEMYENFDSLRLNLSGRAIKQRRARLQKEQQ